MLSDRLHQVAQRAEDLDRATAFYRDVLELPLLARFDPPGLVFFDLGSTRLLLEGRSSPSMLYLGVHDIEAAVRSLTAKGVAFEQGAHRIHIDTDGQFGPAGNEEWMAFFRDSEDNVVGLVEQRLPG